MRSSTLSQKIFFAIFALLNTAPLLASDTTAADELLDDLGRENEVRWISNDEFGHLLDMLRNSIDDEELKQQIVDVRFALNDIPQLVSSYLYWKTLRDSYKNASKGIGIDPDPAMERTPRLAAITLAQSGAGFNITYNYRLRSPSEFYDYMVRSTGAALTGLTGFLNDDIPEIMRRLKELPIRGTAPVYKCYYEGIICDQTTQKTLKCKLYELLCVASHFVSVDIGVNIGK